MAPAPPPARERKLPETLPMTLPMARENRPRHVEATESRRARRQPTTALNDDLLEEVLLRVASPSDLARASAACASFRRLITDRTFLRRYRSLHPPLFLGFIHSDGSFVAAQAPHPNAAAARGLLQAAGDGFSFNEYLPPGRWDTWQACEARDGLVLLNYCWPCGMDTAHIFPDLAVCDPLHRKHLLLPAIRNELVASVHIQKRKNWPMFEAFLAPSGCDEEDDTFFRVIAVVNCGEKVVVFVFSSGSNRWSIGTSTTWADLSFKSPQDISGLSLPGRAYGCFYWHLRDANKLLKLDTDRMEFSPVDLPARAHGSNITILEAGEGGLGMFAHSSRDRYVDYYHATRKNDSSWRMVHRLPVPDETPTGFSIIGVSEDYILLFGIPGAGLGACLSIEAKTFKIEMVTSVNSSSLYDFCPYIGYPLFMSPRRI